MPRTYADPSEDTGGGAATRHPGVSPSRGPAMNHPNESSVGGPGRQIRSWRWTGVGVLAALITSWLGGISAPRLLEAQQVRADRPGPAVRPRMGSTRLPGADRQRIA